jgi:hypothetical protein
MPVKAAQHLLFLAQSQHDTLDRWGYHIRPVHYYEPLPNFATITEESINRRREYPALNFNWPEQLRLVNELSTYRPELEELCLDRSFDFDNGFFSGFDAASYYALIRHLKPRRVLEVGGGYSTRIAAKALARNRAEAVESSLKCIEPYPESRLTDEIPQANLITKPVQDVPTEIFQELQANDILFIDSSHTVKFGSDVCYLFLEILPALSAGVWIHVHDIFFPNDYPAEWLIEQRLALNEQYLLEAFLSFNVNFQIALSNHWLCSDHPSQTRHLLPANIEMSSKATPSSFWMIKYSTSNEVSLGH